MQTHRYGPGNKKKEKRLKEKENQSRAQSSRAIGESGIMKSLARTQEATGSAHVTLQGGAISSASAFSSTDLTKLAKEMLEKKKKKAEQKTKKAEKEKGQKR